MESIHSLLIHQFFFKSYSHSAFQICPREVDITWFSIKISVTDRNYSTVTLLARFLG